MPTEWLSRKASSRSEGFCIRRQGVWTVDSTCPRLDKIERKGLEYTANVLVYTTIPSYLTRSCSVLL